MTAVIGTYDYTFGGGKEPNRRIQFSREGNKAANIQADIFVIETDGKMGEKPRCTVGGDKISVEMESATSKAQRVSALQAGKKNEMLSSLTTAAQNNLMKSLATRRIEITQGSMSYKGGEVAFELTIFDPN